MEQATRTQTHREKTNLLKDSVPVVTADIDGVDPIHDRLARRLPVRPVGRRCRQGRAHDVTPRRALRREDDVRDGRRGRLLLSLGPLGDQSLDQIFQVVDPLAHGIAIGVAVAAGRGWHGAVLGPAELA